MRVQMADAKSELIWTMTGPQGDNLEAWVSDPSQLGESFITLLNQFYLVQLNKKTLVEFSQRHIRLVLTKNGVIQDNEKIQNYLCDWFEKAKLIATGRSVSGTLSECLGRSDHWYF